MERAKTKSAEHEAQKASLTAQRTEASPSKGEHHPLPIPAPAVPGRTLSNVGQNSRARFVKRTASSLLPLVATGFFAIVLLARMSDQTWFAGFSLRQHSSQIARSLFPLATLSNFGVASLLQDPQFSTEDSSLADVGPLVGALLEDRFQKLPPDQMTSVSPSSSEMDPDENLATANNTRSPASRVELDAQDDPGSAAAPSPVDGEAPTKPCVPLRRRRRQVVRGNVRQAVSALAAPRLSVKEQETLGVPGSKRWRWQVWRYFQERPWTKRNGTSVQLGLDDIGRRIQAMESSLWEMEQRDREEAALDVCPDDGASVNLSGAVLDEGEPHNWGWCWPEGRPYSAGLLDELKGMFGAAQEGGVADGNATKARPKFLVLGYTVEQLSKGKIHLAEAARLAQRTNRILVVPGGSNSRLSVARPLPLCNYLALEELTANNIKWITHDLLLLLLARYVPYRPKAAFLCLETKSLWRPCARFVEVSQITEYILALSYSTIPKYDTLVSVDLPWYPPMDPTSTLQTFEKWSAVDIVLYLKTTPAVLGFSNPGAPQYADKVVPYPRHLHAQVMKLSKKLGWPYAALHFRSEFVVFTLATMKKENQIVEQMGQCTHQATLLAMRVAARIGAKSVFIAADIPWHPPASSSNSTGRTVTAGSPSVPERSESWRWMTERLGRNRTMDVAEESLRYLRHRVPSTFMLDELDPSVNLMDPGEMSILDKLMCAHADAFLAGVQLCGGLRAYDGDITRQRYYLHKPKESIMRWESKVL